VLSPALLFARAVWAVWVPLHRGLPDRLVMLFMWLLEGRWAVHVFVSLAFLVLSRRR
jgi:hypothetical protein